VLRTFSKRLVDSCSGLIVVGNVVYLDPPILTIPTGELSALNGVAGAMSERVKMIHVVGQTTRAMQKNHMMIHHSIGDKPDHQVCCPQSSKNKC
jgi:hypothetical protein